MLNPETLATLGTRHRTLEKTVEGNDEWTVQPSKYYTLYVIQDLHRGYGLIFPVSVLYSLSRRNCKLPSSDNIQEYRNYIYV